MSEFPNGWRAFTLADLAGPKGLLSDGDWIESKDQDPTGTIRLTQLADIGDGKFLNKSARYVNAKTAARLRCTLLEEGDLLIARMPDPLGRACIFPGVEQPAITAVDVFIWRTDGSRADARWVMYAINGHDMREKIQSEAGGTTRQRVAGGKLKRITLPTPSLTEQRRIVAKLDSLTGRTARAQEQLGRIPKLIQKYREAILTGAHAQALVQSARELSLGQIAIEVRNGLSRRPENHPPGIPILKISAIRPMAVRINELRYYVPTEGEDVQRFHVHTDDLLFTRYNGNPDLVASCGLVGHVDTPLVYPDKLIRVRLNQAIAEPAFVEALFATTPIRQKLEPFIKSAAGQHGISGGDLKSVTLPLPALSIQVEIVRRVKTAFAWLDRVATEHANASRLLPRLDQAILAKAFRGELAPQDPDDKPLELSVPPDVSNHGRRSTRQRAGVAR